MKLEFKTNVIMFLFGILLLSSSYVSAEDKAIKEKPTGSISDIETTGIRGSNNPIIINDDDIDENVEKLIETSDDEKQTKDETEPAK